MEGAGIGRSVPALVPAEQGATMGTCIDERVQLATPVAGDDDGLAADVGLQVVILVRDLTLVRQVDPITFENMLHFELEYRRVREDIARNSEGASVSVIDDCRCKGLLHALEHIRSSY